MGYRKEPIPDLVRIPGEGSGPVWQDGTGNAYTAVRDAYCAFLRVLFPVVAIYAHKLPPVQRDSSVPHIPDIRSFYPIGVLAPYVQMTPAQQEAANSLYIEIGRAVMAAYNAGQENGCNLLAGLAKGEVSISDFNVGARVTEPKEED
jgi:hypothetical protein